MLFLCFYSLCRGSPLPKMLPGTSWPVLPFLDSLSLSIPNQMLILIPAACCIFPRFECGSYCLRPQLKLHTSAFLPAILEFGIPCSVFCFLDATLPLCLCSQAVQLPKRVCQLACILPASASSCSAPNLCLPINWVQRGGGVGGVLRFVPVPPLLVFNEGSGTDIQPASVCCLSRFI